LLQANEFRYNRQQYEEKAREWTQNHARSTTTATGDTTTTTTTTVASASIKSTDMNIEGLSAQVYTVCS